MLKQAVNFRLHPNTLALLTELATEQHTSKTAVIEAAVAAYAQQKIPHSSLSDFAGRLSSAEGDDWLHTIQTSRKNKTHTAL